MDKLGANTAVMQEILGIVNNLPNAGEGGGDAIIDVTALPTENINENVFYRLLTGTFVYNQFTQNSWKCHCVDALPETGELAVSGDLSDMDSWVITAYYNTADGEVYAYVDDALGGVFGVPAGWYPFGVLSAAVNVSFSGVITDISDDPADSTYRLLLTRVLYSNKDGIWTAQKSIGWAGQGAAAEIFNLPWNKAFGQASHAEGQGTVAGDPDTPNTFGQHAEGVFTSAIAEGSHAEGYNTYAKGDYSHAEGDTTTATGAGAHAEGSYSHAIGNFSHAEGDESRAKGNGSHAEGRATEADGLYSHAEGEFTVARMRDQHVQGMSNLEDPLYDPNNPDSYMRGQYLHIVGNGSYPKRSNAHTLDWNGLGWFQGGLKVGGTGQDDPNAEEIPTKSQVQALINEALGVIENGTY